MKKIGKRVIISIAFLIAMICTAVFAVNNSEAGLSVSAATEESKYEYHDGSFYMPENEARAFLGFLYDLNPEKLDEIIQNDDTTLKFLTGQLQGAENEYPVKLAFTQLVTDELNKKVGKYSNASVVSSEILIDWLNSQVGQNMAEEIINDTCNHYLNLLKESILDVVAGSLMVTETEYMAIETALDGWNTVTGSVAKGEQAAEAIRAGFSALTYAASSSRTAMYKYVISYIQTRDLADSTADGFELAMNYNVLALSSEGLYDPFLNWASDDHVKVLNRWAELIYWLTNDFGGADFNNGESTDDEEYVPIVEFTPGTKVYTGQCGENVYYCLDTKTGVLDIFGSGDMYNYGDAPWTDYRKYVYKVNIRDGVTSIGRCAFYNCTTLSFVNIGNDVTSIGAYAFEYCGGLVSLIIPENVTEISYHVFEKCTGIKKIIISEGVKNIGGDAFYGCNSIENVFYKGDLAGWCGISFNSKTSNPIYYADHLYIDGVLIEGIVSFPDTISAIRPYAFYGCADITGIVIPDNITSVGGSAFDECDEIKSIVVGDGLTYITQFTFTDYPDLETAVIGDGVKNIGTLFAGCSKLKSVSIGRGVTEIADSAFNGCRSLVSVIISEGVTSIGDKAFYNCPNLLTIRIPEGVTSIGDSAFYGCTGLTYVTIGNGVTILEDYVFYNCSGIKELSMPACIDIYTNEDTFYNCSNIEKMTFTKGNGMMLNYNFGGISLDSIKEIIIEEGVTNIGSQAFKNCTKLTSVTIPDSVTSIGNYAFYGCSGLESITIPDSVITIGNGAFNGCSGLESSVTIPDSVTTIGNGAFYGCSGLESVTIPDSVTSIENYTFYGCSGLESVTIPNSVTSIGNETFRGCSGLESVTIPDSVTSIGNYAFSGCSRLESVTIPDSVTNLGSYAFSACRGLTNIVVSDNLTTINAGTFYYCDGLTSIVIPNSITDIRGSAFYNCSGIKKLSMPASAKIYSSSSFEGCYNIEKVVLTKGTGVMQDYRNYYGGANNATHYEVTPWYISKDSIKEVVIEDGVSNIGTYAFYECTKLTTVVIGDGVTSIGEKAFFQCPNLTNVNFPASLTIIGNNAFRFCKKLSGELGENVTSIGDEAFYECSGLTGVIGESVTSVGKFAFSGCSGLTKVIGNNLTSIGRQAFSVCVGLTSVTIGDSITKISDYAFYGCSGLTSITIPDNVIYIGDHAFYGCYGIKEMSIPVSADIHKKAFWRCSRIEKIMLTKGTGLMQDYSLSSSSNVDTCYQCTPWYISRNSIKEIIIEDGVINIGSYAFYGCNGLISIEMPNSVTNIGVGAFDNCKNMEYVHIPASVTTIGIAIISESTFICSDTEDSYAKTYAEENGYTFKLCDNHVTHVESISFDVSEIEMVNKNEYQLNPIITPEDAYDKTVVWVSDNETVATVDENGVVTAVSIGTANITATATDRGYSASCSVSVLPREFKVTWIVDGVEQIDTVKEESEIIALRNPEKEGYIFLGWTPSVPESMPAYDLTFTAVFDEYYVCPHCEKEYIGGEIIDEHIITEAKMNSTVEIKNNPDSKTINYGETLKLTASFVSDYKDISIYWYIDGVKKGEGETFNVSFEGGTKTVTAKAVDSEGNVLTDADGNEISESQKVTVKSGFFQKLISFFKNLFGVNRIIAQAFI